MRHYFRIRKVLLDTELKWKNVWDERCMRIFYSWFGVQIHEPIYTHSCLRTHYAPRPRDARLWAWIESSKYFTKHSSLFLSTFRKLMIYCFSVRRFRCAKNAMFLTFWRLKIHITHTFRLFGCCCLLCHNKMLRMIKRTSYVYVQYLPSIVIV